MSRPPVATQSPRPPHVAYPPFLPPSQLEPTAAVRGTTSYYTGMVQAARTIVRDEGVVGLWRGTLPGQLLTIPYCAAQFVTLQHCRGEPHTPCQEHK